MSDDTITRERRTMRARYQLVDLNTGAIALDATASVDEGLDVVSSEYAVIAAEQTAQENPRASCPTRSSPAWPRACAPPSGANSPSPRRPRRRRPIRAKAAKAPVAPLPPRRTLILR
jgi:cell division septation protein DedD